MEEDCIKRRRINFVRCGKLETQVVVERVKLLIWLIVLSGWPPNEVLESLQFNDICGYSEYPQRVFKIKIELVVQQIPTE